MKEFVGKHWYLGPLLALVAMAFCYPNDQEERRAKIANLATNSITRIYGLASDGDYNGIVKAKLLSGEGVEFLRAQQNRFGKIKEWRIVRVASAEGYGHLWSGVVYCKREGLESYDGVTNYSTTSDTTDISNPLEEGEYYEEQPPLNAAAALHIARRYIHEHADGKAKVESVTPQPVDAGWVVTEVDLEKGVRKKMYILIGKDQFIARIREKLSDYPSLTEEDIVNLVSLGRYGYE